MGLGPGYCRWGRVGGGVWWTKACEDGVVISLRVSV